MCAEEHPGPDNSRTSEAGAGWTCQKPGTFHDLLPERVADFSWRRPRVLWRSRNDVLARLFGDPSNAIRRRCVAALRERGTPAAFTVHRSEPEFSFALLGDTGEGDRSQYAVVPALLNAAAGTDFMIIASDVIYPAGDADEYPDKFFRPYRDYPRPHLRHPRQPRLVRRPARLPPRLLRPRRGLLAAAVARPAVVPAPPAVARAGRGGRGRPRRGPPPPPGRAGPAGRPARAVLGIDTPSLRIIGVDTGITGSLDRDQGRWLREVSAGPKPKLLVTGKPLYVDDEHRPGAIEGGGTVDEIVQDPAHNYVAAIGGDIHNYQRYPVTTEDGRTIQYIVSGGGGAFMHATHTIPR